MLPSSESTAPHCRLLATDMLRLLAGSRLPMPPAPPQRRPLKTSFPPHLAKPTSASLAVRSRDSRTLRALTSKCVYVAECR